MGRWATPFLVVVAVLVTLWACDLVVSFMPPLPQTPDDQRRAAERAAGVTVDPRDMLAVVRDLRRRNEDAVPAIYVGNHWRGWPAFRDTLYPLGGISNVVSVMCSEGTWRVYRADEHGLTNPPGQWARKDIDLALLGDSFTQGWCVDTAQSLASLIRAKHPATIVAGFGASGPLTQLAQVRELLEPLRPRLVLWFYFEGNDLTDLDREKVNPILARYLDTTFTQRLAARQGDVDAHLRAYEAHAESLAVAKERTTLAPARPGLVARAWSVIKLRHLRERFFAKRPPEPRLTCCDLGLYGRVAGLVKQRVESWGGRLAVVYLPSGTRLAGRKPLAPEEAAGDRVTALLDTLGIPVVDLRGSLPAFGSARELYVYPEAHFTVKGHAAAASIVLSWLGTHGFAGVTP